MTGRYLHADAGLALGNNGIVETGNVDAFLLQLGSEVLRQLGVVEHHGADSALGGLDVKAGSDHLVAEVVHVVHELVVQCVALLEHLEHLDAGTHDAGSDAVAEQVGT